MRVGSVLRMSLWLTLFIMKIKAFNELDKAVGEGSIVNDDYADDWINEM